MLDRQKLLNIWLNKNCKLQVDALHQMPHDASFRRYYRVHSLRQSFVVMDAQSEIENCHAFVTIARGLRAHSIQTPEIIHEDLSQGFLLLTDFGDATYLKSLTENNADALYQTALKTLARIQRAKLSNYSLPHFTREWLEKEWMWYKEWFLQKWLSCEIENIQALDQCYEIILQSALSQPQVFMHRDYHSANLMLLKDMQVGVLDFQDAFLGPLTYDLASLLRDCYIDWPKERVINWAKYYLHELQMNGEFTEIKLTDFLYWFDLMSVQRHLKALMTFSRKAERDQQTNYLQYIPRTLNYLKTISASYPELKMLHQFLDTITPAVRRKLSCAQ